MSIRVYGAEQNPATDHFLYRCSCSSGASLLATGRGLTVIDGDGRRAVQLLHGIETRNDAFDLAERVGLSNLIPFGRVLNPMLAPQKLHYEVPMAGASHVLSGDRSTRCGKHIQRLPSSPARRRRNTRNKLKITKPQETA